MLGHFGIAFLGLWDKNTRHYCDVCITRCLSARTPRYNVCTTYVQPYVQRMYVCVQRMYNVCTTYVQRWTLRWTLRWTHEQQQPLISPSQLIIPSERMEVPSIPIDLTIRGDGSTFHPIWSHHQRGWKQPPSPLISPSERMEANLSPDWYTPPLLLTSGPYHK